MIPLNYPLVCFHIQLIYVKIRIFIIRLIQAWYSDSPKWYLPKIKQVSVNTFPTMKTKYLQPRQQHLNHKLFNKTHNLIHSSLLNNLWYMIQAISNQTNHVVQVGCANPKYLKNGRRIWMMGLSADSFYTSVTDGCSATTLSLVWSSLSGTGPTRDFERANIPSSFSFLWQKQHNKTSPAKITALMIPITTPNFELPAVAPGRIVCGRPRMGSCLTSAASPKTWNILRSEIKTMQKCCVFLDRYAAILGDS